MEGVNGFLCVAVEIFVPGARSSTAPDAAARWDESSCADTSRIGYSLRFDWTSDTEARYSAACCGDQRRHAEGDGRMRRFSGCMVALLSVALGGGTPFAWAQEPGIGIVTSTLTAFGSGISTDPNAANVPNVPPGEAVQWRYIVSNTGETIVPFDSLSVSDAQPGVVVYFATVLVGDADNQFEPGEQWLFQADGTALDLKSPPSDIFVRAGACTHGGTEPPRNAYAGFGIASIPGATATHPSFYCNPAGADVPAAGNQARLADSATPSRRKNLIGLHDAAIDLTGLDPTVTGVTVQIGRIGSGPVVTFDLPAGGWRRTSAPMADYRFRSRTGPVDSAWLRDGALVRITASGPDAFPLVDAPGDLGVIVEIDGVRFCGVFGGEIRRDDTRRFQALRAPAPSSCPTLGAP
jgi:hypothetical protein